MKRVFVGVAWPYSNGPIHIGQVGGCYLPPDIFKRYHQMKGFDVLMVSGSDQHGTPVAAAAEKEGITPTELADRYHQINTKALEDLGVDFTLFTYTTHPTHKRVAQDIFKSLYDKGYIYKEFMETFYCKDCDKFLPDRYVIGICPRCGAEDIKGDQCDECGLLLDPQDLNDPTCTFCGGRPELKESEHFFLKLSAFQEPLEDYINSRENWKNHVVNFTMGWLEEGLKDRPISRDMEWGIPVPIEGYEDKKIYVWFEAVIGYLSTAIQWSEKTGNDWGSYWKDDDTPHYYFLAKDNIPFHTIIWPAMLMGYDDELNLPYNVPANQFMRFEGKQFSTSRGLFVSLPDMLEDFDADAIRYYVTAIMPELRDSNFSWEDFVEKNNTELVGNMGNFVHRVLSFAYSRFGEIPEAHGLDERDEDALSKMKECVDNVGKAIEECRFKDGIRSLFDLSREGNRYFNERAPWVEYKENPERCATTINTAIRMVKAIAVSGAPYLPHSMETLWKYLGMENSVNHRNWDEAIEAPKGKQKLQEPKPLYKNIDLDDIFKDAPFNAALERLDLRVAEIVAVEEHPNADKLQVIKVNIGDHERTLVAGLKEYYAPEELVGKRVIVVANLEPAKLRGIESQGMILAGQDEDTVSLVLAHADPGEQVKGTKEGAPTISFKEFQGFDIQAVNISEEQVLGKEIYEPVDDESEFTSGIAFVINKRAKVLSAGGNDLTMHRDISLGSEIR